MGCKKRRWQLRKQAEMERRKKKEEAFTIGLKQLQTKYLNHPAYLAATKARYDLMEKATALDTDEAWEELYALSREQGEALQETGRTEDYDNWWTEYLDLQEYVASL